MKRTAVLAVYCLPAIVACAILLYGYYLRAGEVSQQIHEVAQGVAQGDEAKIKAWEDKYLEETNHVRRMINLFQRKKAFHTLASDAAPEQIQNEVRRIWAFNSMLVFGFTLLPFVLLGGRLAYRRRHRVLPRDIFQVARRAWAIKLLVGFAIAFGWIYILNPSGRGASLMVQYVNGVDALAADTLPIYIEPRGLIAPVLCGFMGWYLHLIGYFFRKVVLDDAISTRVYDLVFRKLLLVYGIGLIVSEMVTDQGKLLLFLIGFMPLNALATIRNLAQKQFPGSAPKRDALSQIPSISRWQIFRLEEEGIDSIPALAAARIDILAAVMPVKSTLIHLWVDAARLVTLIGASRYEKVSKHCMTASEFVRRHEDPDFVQLLADECDIGNPGEIVSLLDSTFGEETLEDEEERTIMPTAG